MRLRDFLKIFDLLAGLRFRPQLFEFNAAVVPIEFLTQVPNSPDQVALPHFPKRKALSALENHLDHVARLRGFDAGKSFFSGSPGIATAQVESDERFIDLHPVFHEGNLELLTPKTAAQSFNRGSGFEVCAVSGLPIAASTSDLPFEEMRLIDQHRRLEPRKLRNGGSSLLISYSKIFNLKSDLGQQKVS